MKGSHRVQPVHHVLCPDMMAKTCGDIEGHLHMIVHQELYVFLDELANLLLIFLAAQQTDL